MAAPPVYTTPVFEDGVIIEAPAITYLKQNQDFKFHFHAFNKSNGVSFTDDITSCIFHLYNSTGDHILKAPTEYDALDFEILIDGDNFTQLGSYAYIIQCNTSVYGGYTQRGITVTGDGNDPNVGLKLFIILLVFSIILLSMGLILDNEIFGVLSGFSFSITGIYSMIYGFSVTVSLYTRMISLIILGIGLIITVVSALDLIEAAENSGGED